VLVEYKQGGAVLESVHMKPATDTDSEAECYLFPYPVSQTVQRVRAEWEEIKNKIGSTRGRELGFLKSALVRIRTIFQDMVEGIVKDGGATIPARRPANPGYTEMGPIHRALLAYAMQDYKDVGATASGWSVDEDGKIGSQGSSLIKRTSSQTDQTGQTGEPKFNLLRFYPSTVKASIAVTINGKTRWELEQPKKPHINAHFQAERARLNTLLPSNDVAGSASIPAVFGAIQMADSNAEKLTKPLGAINDMRQQVLTSLEVPLKEGLTKPRQFLMNKPFAVFRVYGPPLLRKPTQETPLARGDEADDVAEARAALREAQRFLVPDFERAQLGNRGPLRVMECFSELPKDTRHIQTVVSLSEWAFGELHYRKNAFVTTGVPPLGVETCTGAFRPTEAVSEEDVRVRLGSDTPIDALSRLGLGHTPEAQAALVAFSDLTVHECLSAITPVHPRDDPIDSAVRRAQQHAVFAARLLRSMYSSTSRTEKLLLGHTDPLFITAPGGRAALVCVRHLSCWAIANSRDLAANSNPTVRTLWSGACRTSATRFTEALDRLGRLDRWPIHPVAFPLLPLQALWSWPSSSTSVSAGTHGQLVVERRLEMARQSAVRATDLSTTTESVQAHAARVSVARAVYFMKALDPNIDVAQVTEHVLFARPAAVRAGEQGLVPYENARLTQLLKSFPGGDNEHTRHNIPRGVLRSAWARRALDTYGRWRHADVAGSEGDDVSAALANLSLSRDRVNSGRAQEFYVPYGLVSGASPLSGNNTAVSETRMFTSAMRMIKPSGNDPRVSLVLYPCKPHDGVLHSSGGEYKWVEHVHPYLLIMDHATSELKVPISLTKLDDAVVAGGKGEEYSLLEQTQLCDRVRSIAFTAERLYQALQLASACGFNAATLRPTQVDATTHPLLAASLALALGMLPNVGVLNFAIAVEDGEAEGGVREFYDVQTRCNAAAESLGDEDGLLHELTLAEAAAAMASAI
jgi:hypothetical protein